MQKKQLLALMLVLMIGLLGCSQETAAPAGDESSDQPAVMEVTGLEGPIAEYPVIVTSSGQSADIEMIKALLENIEMEYEVEAGMTADQLQGYKSIIFAVGGSSKGLGAAGIDPEDEVDRTKAIIEKAKAENMVIIAAHIGGESRRGELSDKFVDAVFPYADYIVAVDEGDHDGLFSQIASQNSIPIEFSDKISGVGALIKKAFQ